MWEYSFTREDFSAYVYGLRDIDSQKVAKRNPTYAESIDRVGDRAVASEWAGEWMDWGSASFGTGRGSRCERAQRRCSQGSRATESAGGSVVPNWTV
jgi:hypothetical protein